MNKNESGLVSVPLDLSPLLNDGRRCLACSDVKGIARVTLKEVEFYYGGAPWQGIVRWSDDVFSLLERGIFKWPALGRIKRAGFDVRFADAKEARRVNLCPGSPMQASRDEAWPIVARWMAARRFMEAKADEAWIME